MHGSNINSFVWSISYRLGLETNLFIEQVFLPFRNGLRAFLPLLFLIVAPEGLVAS